MAITTLETALNIALSCASQLQGGGPEQTAGASKVNRDYAAEAEVWRDLDDDFAKLSRYCRDKALQAEAHAENHAANLADLEARGL